MGHNKGNLWIADDVVAYVENGAVTLQIDQPVRALPALPARDVADKVWFASQMRALEVARRKGETCTIPLTDRRRRSSLRLGGGFMVTQGTKLVIARRTAFAPRRPGLFCEFGGIFEVVEPTDPYALENNLIVSLLKESQEIALVCGNRLFVPKLAALLGLPNPKEPAIGFQPPGEPPPDRPKEDPLSRYNDIVQKELDGECERARIPGCSKLERLRFNVKILNYENSIKLQYAYAPEISVEITAEVDTSSLEFVGVLGYPSDVVAAASAVLDDQRAQETLQRMNDVSGGIRSSAATASGGAKVGGAQSVQTPQPAAESVEYWDTECIFDVPDKDGYFRNIGAELVGANAQVNGPPMETDLWSYEKGKDRVTGADGVFFPLDRRVYCIDFESLEVEVWETRRQIGSPLDPATRTRVRGPACRLHDLLSTVNLERTRSHFTTEKLTKAMKMHCPFPRLQPFITL
jgi:hypothetical protein